MGTSSEEANLSVINGKLSDAIKKYTALLKSNPNNTTVLINRGIAQFRTGLYRKAQSDATAALALSKSLPTAVLLNVACLLKLNKESDAVTAARTSIESAAIDDLQAFELLHLFSKNPQTYGNTLLQYFAQPAATTVATATTTTTTTAAAKAASSSATKAQKPNAAAAAAAAAATVDQQRLLIEQLIAAGILKGDNATAATAAAAAAAAAAEQQDSFFISRKASDANEAVNVTEEQLLLAASSNMIRGGVGNISIDQKIAMGYLSVNTGKLPEAVRLFTELLVEHPTVVAGYLGRGTAFALLGKLDDSIRDFSSAIQIDGTNADAWRRRGQARAARGYTQEALMDMTRSIELAPEEGESYHQRGILYHKMKNYREAIADLRKCVALQPDKSAFNLLGLCLNATGHCLEAIDVYGQAVLMDPQYKDAWLNMGQAYKDWGIPDKAETYYAKALSLDPRYSYVYHLRSIERYGVGDIAGALQDCIKGSEIDPSNKEMLCLKAVSYHNLGQFENAIRSYDWLLTADRANACWYQREVALYVMNRIDTPFVEFNIDLDLDPYFKEAWCKRADPILLKTYVKQSKPKSQIPDIKVATRVEDLSPEAVKLLRYTAPIGAKLQLTTPGFLPNKRQHRMCGLAVVELAQTARKLWEQNGKMEVTNPKTTASVQHGTPHNFNYRDFVDIAVKWRQYSEPNDTVWWIDLLAPEAYEEGFGLQTPMLTGQTEVPRYFPYCGWAFREVKELLFEQWALTDEMRDAIQKAADVDELHKIMGKDFWVVTNCFSTMRKDHIMEGTRLTLVRKPNNEGFEFTIRTPATPPRWKDFDIELAGIWEKLTQTAIRYLAAVNQSSGGTEAESSEAGAEAADKLLDDLSDLILRFYFYWVSFAPLTRGTAATGLMCLMALFLAVDIDLGSITKTGVQMDFESILGGDPNRFVREVSEWMYPLRKKITDSAETIHALPLAADVAATPRALIELLNAKI